MWKLSGLWKRTWKIGTMTSFTKTDITKPFIFYEAFYYPPISGDPDDDPYEDAQTNREFLGNFLTKADAEKYGMNSMWKKLTKKAFKKGLRCVPRYMNVRGATASYWDNVTDESNLS